jgi:hypothetical protein
MWKIGQTLPDGSDAGIVNAMNHWAEKLGGYQNNPATIKRVLETLPEEPPTLPKFLEMCRHSYVAPPVVQIEHKLTEEQMAKNKQRVQELIAGLRVSMATKGESK